MSSKPKTPGYNTRLEVFFKTDRRGNQLAFRWSWFQLRAFRVPTAEALLWVAQDQADQLPGHPLKDLKG